VLWATRRGCHVDRTACVWLIKRFVDPGASFAFFGDPAEAPEGAELFDVVGARRKIEDLVRKLNARLALTMVFVNHDLSQVGRVADRVVLLAEGKSVGEWEREDFFSAAGERWWC
jgi:ABC-type cobalamin transport system ATPase subunit